MVGTPRSKCPECGRKTISVSARIGNGIDDERPTSRKPHRRVGWICTNCLYMERTVPEFSEMKF